MAEVGSTQADGVIVSRRAFISTAVAGATLAGGTPVAAGVGPVATDTPPEVDRAFVRLREGLVHYRSVGDLTGPSARLPLYMAHAGPGSSSAYGPILQRLGRHRTVIAPDTLGAGDSVAPDVAEPDIGYYADSIVRILDRLGIAQIDYYGAHIGAQIGVELAIRAPARVRRIVLDGVPLFPDALKAELLARYAPPMPPDEYGHQLAFAWQFVRDMRLFFPHYARDPDHRMPYAVGTPDSLHNGVVEVLKAIRTYHLGYHAGFRHDIARRLPLLRLPVLCMGSQTDPITRYQDEAAALIPGAAKYVLPAGAPLEAKAAAIESFLGA